MLSIARIDVILKIQCCLMPKRSVLVVAHVRVAHTCLLALGG
jgi:hypothetical protein